MQILKTHTPCRACGEEIAMTGGFCYTMKIAYGGYRCWKCCRAEAMTAKLLANLGPDSRIPLHDILEDELQIGDMTDPEQIRNIPLIKVERALIRINARIEAIRRQKAR